MADHGTTASCVRVSRSGNVLDNAAMETCLVVKDRAHRAETRNCTARAMTQRLDYIERSYNRASEHPSGYVIEEKRLC
jgi:hypothetical protein